MSISAGGSEVGSEDVGFAGSCSKLVKTLVTGTFQVSQDCSTYAHLETKHIRSGYWTSSVGTTEGVDSGCVLRMKVLTLFVRATPTRAAMRLGLLPERLVAS